MRHRKRDPNKVTARQLGEGIAVMLELCAFYEPFLEWPPDQPKKTDAKYREIWRRHDLKLRGYEQALRNAKRPSSLNDRKNGRRRRGRMEERLEVG